MKNIVMTGATGFLGSNLAGEFLRRGDRVYALVRPNSAHMASLPLHENLVIIPCALDHVTECAAQIPSADAFFHFAWGGVNREEIDSPAVQAENIKGSVDCVKTARLLGCSLFMDAGSRVEYGVTGEAMSETSLCLPANEYGKAKLEFFQKASSLCAENELKYCHLRFFSVYGYGDHPWSIISTLVRDLSQEKNVSLSACLHRWNFMYIDDAVAAVRDLYDSVSGDETIKAGQPGAVNIASTDTRQLKSFVEEVRESVGSGRLEYGTFAQAKEGALSLSPDTKKLQALTGGVFRERYSFREGIAEMIKKEVERKDEKN